MGRAIQLLNNGGQMFKLLFLNLDVAASFFFDDLRLANVNNSF